MCPYLPDLFVCVPQIFAELNSCNWIKLPKTFSRKTRRTTWKEMIYIYWGQENWKWKRKMKSNEEDIVKDGLAVHIFGCINFPSEWRTFDGCVNRPNVKQQVVQFRFCHFALVHWPWHLTKRKVLAFFGKRALFIVSGALKGWSRDKFTGEVPVSTLCELTFDIKLVFFLLSI